MAASWYAWRRSSRQNHPAGSGRPDAGPPAAVGSRTDRALPGAGEQQPWTEEPWLDEMDWSDIDRLLAGSVPEAASVEAGCVEAACVEAAAAGVEALLTEPFIGATRLTNPLLELWAAVRNLGPRASAPVETLLSVLPERHLIAAAEAAAACTEVRRVAGLEVCT